MVQSDLRAFGFVCRDELDVSGVASLRNADKADCVTVTIKTRFNPPERCGMKRRPTGTIRLSHVPQRRLN
jgi:hypothetical protein